MFLQKDPVSGKYIIRIDASLYSVSNCYRFVFLRLFEGLCGEGKDFKMEYGTAFHKGLALRAEGKSLDLQLAATIEHFSQPDIIVPENEWRNAGHLMGCYIQYDTYYKKNGDLLIPVKGSDGKVLVEQKFAYPFYKTDRVEVLLCGTIDLIADYIGQRVIVDHKTTSAWPDTYLGEYNLSSQLMIYKYIYDKLFGTDVGCMINGVFLNKSNKNQFKRTEPVLRFSTWQIDNVITHLHNRTKDIVSRFEYYLDKGINLFEHNYTQCTKHFNEFTVSKCMMSSICQCATPEDASSVADTFYQRSIYDPSQFQK